MESWHYQLGESLAYEAKPEVCGCELLEDPFDLEFPASASRCFLPKQT